MPEKKKSIYEKLSSIQSDIKVAKKRYNSFGGFYYRSLEDIFEELKPLLSKYKVSILLSDDIAVIENRVYVKGVAHLIDIETKEEITVSAFAREPDMKKGMDPMQITGATSSYARKYALAGLLLLDDNQDADAQTTNEQPETQDDIPDNVVKPPKKTQKPVNTNKPPFDKKAFLQQVNNVIKDKKLPNDVINVFLQAHNLKKFEDVKDKDTAINIYIDLKNIKIEEAKNEK